MAENTPPPEPVLLAGTPLSDRALEQTLGRVAEQQKPDPAFAEKLRQRLHAPAARHNAAVPVLLASPRLRLNGRRLLVAALSFGASAAAIWALAPRRTLLPPLPAINRTLSADDPVRLRAPAGRRVAARIADRQRPLLDLELRDGAEVSYRPGEPPRLELAAGFMRLAGRGDVIVRAADQELIVRAGSDLALELTLNPEGGTKMRTVWLVPTSAAAGAAVTLAVLVAQGQVAFSQGTGPEKVPPAGEVLVLKTGEMAGPAQAQRRVADLEKKVSTLQQENGRLAAKLAQGKGVTTANVRERLAALKRSPLPGMLSPGARADLITDLKGLGDEGVRLLLERLKSGDEKERFLAANLLEDLSAPAAIPGLKEAALKDPDKMASAMASHALALMDDAATVPALREISAANKSEATKVNALWGLCKHGDEKAIAEALAMMKDPKLSQDIRMALGGNLLLLHDPELMPIAEETLRLFGKEEQVSMLAIDYYQQVGTAEARARLEAMAADAKLSEAVRAAARTALTTPPK
jgi:HEAT repeat protein